MENSEGIKHYGDLSDNELFDFLSEIEIEDEDISEAESEAIKKIAESEEQDKFADEDELDEEDEALFEAINKDEPEIEFPKETLENNNEGDNDDEPAAQGTPGHGYYRKANLASAAANKLRSQRLKADRLNIQREAFRQDVIRLSDPISDEHIKLLISLLVSEHTRMIDKYSNYINKRLAQLLNPLIPTRIKLCKSLFPNSIRMSPGFLYRASKEFGGGLTFWATPNIPYYFTQHTEQQVLLDEKPDMLYIVDKAVKFYHEHSRKRAEKELKYASLIYVRKVATYFDLLRVNPFWFKTLYDNLTTHNK